jgi:hypothetical protein
MTTPTNYGDLNIVEDPKRPGHFIQIPKARQQGPISQNENVSIPPPAPVLNAPDPDDGPKYKSKTEARYAGRLEGYLKLGKIREYRYECFRVSLADNTTITADFFVVLMDWRVEIHEVKGQYVREDAWIKLKIAAAQWPWFRWFKLQEDEETREWVKTRVPSR